MKIKIFYLICTLHNKNLTPKNLFYLLIKSYFLQKKDLKNLVFLFHKRISFSTVLRILYYTIMNFGSSIFNYPAISNSESVLLIPYLQSPHFYF